MHPHNCLYGLEDDNHIHHKECANTDTLHTDCNNCKADMEVPHKAQIKGGFDSFNKHSNLRYNFCCVRTEAYLP